jgi:type I restriction enzyme S subunit
MNLETFFEKFELFAEAPDAVAKMRELVLELAVRGRLISPYSRDSSAVHDPSRPFTIPQDWQWITLNKAVNCRAAAKVDSASLNDSDWVLDLEDIDGVAGKIVATATFAERRSLSAKASFQKGDVLYGKLRPYLNKVVIADRAGFCTTEIIPLRPQAFVVAGYIRIFLRSAHFLRYAAAKNYGMKMPRLGTQDLESTDVPLPPLAEQKRIVAKVDELMALCDRLEAQQQEREEQASQLARASLARFAEAPTPANLQFLFHSSFRIPTSDLRKSILTLAPRGKLVEQRREEVVAEQNVRPSLPPDELPYGLPEGWVWKRLGDLVEFIGGSQPPKTHFIYEYRDGYTRFIQIRDFKSDANLTFIPTALANRPFKEDDVMIGRYGPPVFQILRGLQGTYNVALMKAEPTSELISKDFLFYLLQEPRIQDRVVAESDRTAGQSGVRKPLLLSFIVAVPPLAEQRRIVARVEQLMALVDTLETQLAASHATAANLLAATVAELTASQG